MRDSIGQELYPLRENPPAEPAEAPAPPPPAETELEVDTSAAADDSDLPEVELEVEPAETWQEVPAANAHLEAAGPIPEDPEEAAREDAMAEDPSFELVGVVENLPDKTSDEAGPSKELVAIRVLLELLESKGVLTREEYVAALRRAAKPD
ncbi:MAG: hypothetical protein KC486_00280 [Myxococcales bacterium]|nr:hypothetical protein [Myxococcales bacterium]